MTRPPSRSPAAATASSVPGALDEAAALAELGVDRIVVPSFLFWKDTAAALAAYGDEVIARV